MNPKRTQVWCCERCGTPYKHKPVAETCCMCTECGNPTPYPGNGRICEVCGLKKTIASNEKHLRETNELLGQQRERLARMTREK